MTRAATAAGIVAFAPRPDLLFSLIEALRPDCGTVFVFVNGSLDAEVRARLEAVDVSLLISDYNLGVAEALNMLALAALLAGHDRIALFDQDSEPPAHMVAALDQGMDLLIAAGERPAAIGPRIVSPAGEEGRYKSPRYFPASGASGKPGLSPVLYLITSGTLLDLRGFRQTGRFRSDFFIDAIDTEWCFRAWSRGLSCWVSEEAHMAHRIGDGIMRPRLLGAAIPRQRAFRLYSYIRNQAYCLRLAHIPMSWRARSAAHLVRVALASAFDGGGERLPLSRALQAFRDGWTGQLGPPPGAQHVARLDLG